MMKTRGFGERENVALQNVELQNGELQNGALQNGELQNVARENGVSNGPFDRVWANAPRHTASAPLGGQACGDPVRTAAGGVLSEGPGGTAYGSTRSGAIAPPPVLLPISTMHLLVVDDDDPVRHACSEIARGMGFTVHAAESVPSARSVLKLQTIDLLLLDLKLPGGGGLQLLEEVKALYPETAVVVMTAYATVSSAVEAMRIGASDYLTKPFALDDLTAKLGRASQQRHHDLEARLLREKLRSQKGDGQGGNQIIGTSPEMERLYRILSKVAFTTHPVLILGESGTGKEMVARAIHANGPNARRPFVPVDCGALVPTLIESELFGHVKGAFTGANRSKEGLLAAAEGGTVFLDEIGELPLDLQAKLLRALQEKEVRPVGATHSVPISARVLAATNRDLSFMVEQGRFRKDLYFRLNVVNLKVPPLRTRREDVPLLAFHFLERMQRETGKQHSFSDDALRLMTAYDWPGNVRELYNAIERACALSSGPLLHMGDLPTQLDDFRRHQQQALFDQRQQLAAQQAGEVPGQLAHNLAHNHGNNLAPTDTSLTQLETGGNIVSIAELEKQAILNTIRQLHGDKLMAAKLLQIGKTTLYRKLKEYGIAEAGEEVH
jgi:DNA-binding NtrC family response regulator